MHSRFYVTEKKKNEQWRFFFLTNELCRDFAAKVLGFQLILNPWNINYPRMFSGLFSKEESFYCFPNLYLLDKLNLFFQIEITIISLYITIGLWKSQFILVECDEISVVNYFKDLYKYLDEEGVHFLLWITVYVFMIFKNSIVLGETGENIFIARIVFFFASKRAQIKSFLLMLYTFYFGSVFYVNVRIF